MNCPKCLGKLSPVEIGNVEIDRCFVCEGLWFASDELERILANYSTELQKIHLDSRIFDGKEASGDYSHFDNKHGDCPRCNAKMFRVRFGDVKAESRPNGHGLWLDGGEIASLKSIKQRNLFELFKYMFSLKAIKDFRKSFGKNPEK
jgi:Zn-finger nucleic acid-binding protein